MSCFKLSLILLRHVMGRDRVEAVSKGNVNGNYKPFAINFKDV